MMHSRQEQGQGSQELGVTGAGTGWVYGAGMRVIDERDLEKVVCPDPSEAAQLRTAGISALDRGDLRTAGRCLDRALALDPSDAGVHAALAALYRQQGQQRAMFDALYRATALDPERLEYQHVLLIELDASISAS